MAFISEFYDFLRTFSGNAETIAALVVGVVIGAAAVLWVLRHWHGRQTVGGPNSELQQEQGKSKLIKELIEERDQRIRDLQAVTKSKDDRIESLTADCERLHEERAALTQSRDKFRNLNETHKENVRTANRTIQVCKGRNNSLKSQLKSHADHLQAIVDLDGKFWERSPQGNVPEFRRRAKGQPPIIALVNLKGGVGKTTLTAHLGATLWERGQRTLLVDLDNQGSLTALCLPDEHLHDLRRASGRFVHHVFRAETPDAELVWQNLTRLGDSQGWLLGATEELAEVEEHVKAKWLIQQNVRDVRYDLRATLHAPLIQDRFDIVLLDCPPRLSTACVNALACCDYVLVPVLLDKTSADAVPRLLRWLRVLKSNGVCPDMKVLGVLANRTHSKLKLTKRETNLWDHLADKCQTAWGEPVHLFDRWIPNKASFADAAESRVLAGLDDEVAPIFLDLLTELHQRTALHDRRRPATVRA